MITPVKPFKVWFKLDVGTVANNLQQHYSIILHMKIGLMTYYIIMESQRCEARMASCLVLQWLSQL